MQAVADYTSIKTVSILGSQINFSNIVPYASFGSTMQTGTHALLFLQTCKHEHICLLTTVDLKMTDKSSSIFLNLSTVVLTSTAYNTKTKTTSHICSDFNKNIKRNI